MNLNEILLASKISGKNNGNVNLSNYYTKSQTDGLISGKVDKEDGKGLSTNDFTDEYKSKVDSSAQQSATYTKSETDQRITSKIAEIVANSPEDFDTLKEISDWIESHEDSAAAMNTAIVANTTAINNKVDKANGMGLSENNFTNDEKTKLSGLENYDDTTIKADIASALSEIALNKGTFGYQRKNLLKNTATSKTQNGLTFTVNEDGSINVNGTATNNTFCYINSNFVVGNKPITLTGCPADGGLSKYQIDILNNNATAMIVAADTGSGKTIDKSMFETDSVTVRVRVNKNATLDDVVFKPMIRYAEITDDTYEPYKPSVEERLEALENAILGDI